ncbi:MAG TPA: glycosyltransferase family 2 protein [Gammaproteobacteria bacterium]|nr:glycosyltransferase family 2 protein [Gammaproteobacteria bacterium]
MKFYIITAMYNVDEWIDENIQALKKQTYENFQAVLIDDISTDKTVQVARQSIGDDSRFELIINSEKQYKTRNVVEAINASCASDEDVVVLVDGDDKLAKPDVLQTLYDVYSEEDCWMTYGSYTGADGHRHKSCKPYRVNIIEQNSYRKTRWLASHLKTFKFKLWKQLGMDAFKVTDKDIAQAKLRSLLKLQLRNWYYWKDIKASDLHDASGNFIRRVDDKAFSWPMLEMSGSRARYIENELYIYRSERRPYNGPDKNYGENKSEKWHTRLIRNVLAHKKSYKRLKEL